MSYPKKEPYEIKAFTTMNNAIDPTLIGDNVLQLIANCNIENGKVKEIKDYKFVRKDIDFSTYKTKNRSIIKWYNHTYWSENNLIKNNYGSSNNEGLGIIKSNIDDFTFTKIKANENKPALTGKFKYAITQINLTQYESVPIFYEITLDNEFVKIEFNKEKSEIIDNIKLYRSGESGEDFFFIDDFYKNKEKKIIEDKVDEIELSAKSICNSQENYPPIQGGKYLTENGGIFFLVKGEKVYFSQLANPHAWHPQKWIQVEDTITAIIPTQNGIIITTTNKTFFANNFYDTNSITIQTIANIGCNSHLNIDKLIEMPVWFTGEHLVAFNGQSIEYISQNVFNFSQKNIKQIFCSKDKIFCLGTKDIVVFDKKVNAFYELEFFAKFGWVDDIDSIYIQINDDFYGILFNGENNVKWTIRTKKIENKSLIFLKFQEAILDTSQGCNITIFVEDKIVINNIKIKPGRQRIKYPLNQNGRDTELLINGYGTLYSIAVLT